MIIIRLRIPASRILANQEVCAAMLPLCMDLASTLTAEYLEYFYLTIKPLETIRVSYPISV